MSTLNYEQLSDRIIAAAKNGGKDGFVIKLGRKTGNSSIIDPLSGEKTDEIVYDQEKKFHKRSISTQDYKRYLDARKQLATEQDEDKRVDITLRLYEYLALKFLGMSHEDFVNADFDDVVVATLACDALFGSGTGNINPQQQPEITANRQIIHTTNPPPPPPPPPPLSKRKQSSSPKPKDTYYKAPDEE